MVSIHGNPPLLYAVLSEGRRRGFVWIRRYILFHGKRHPAEMGAPEVTRFLSALAVDGKVAASSRG